MNKFNYFPWLLLLNIDRVITALVNTSDFSLPCIISLFKVATNPCFKGEKVNITSIAELVHVTQRVSSRLSRQRHPSGALSDFFFFLVSGRNCPARNLGPFAPGSSAVRGVCAVLCCRMSLLSPGDEDEPERFDGLSLLYWYAQPFGSAGVSCLQLGEEPFSPLQAVAVCSCCLLFISSQRLTFRFCWVPGDG